MDIHRITRALAVAVALFFCSCGSSGPAGPDPLPTVVVEAPALADGEGYVVAGGGEIINFSALVSMGDDWTDNRSVGVLCFDITGIGNVTEAILSFHEKADLGDAWGAFQPLFLDHIASDGVLGEENLTDPPLQAQVYTLTKDGDWSLDVTDQVRADVEAGRASSAFRLRFAGDTNGDGLFDSYRVASSKHIDVSARPRLVLTTSP